MIPTFQIVQMMSYTAGCGQKGIKIDDTLTITIC